MISSVGNLQLTVGIL